MAVGVFDAFVDDHTPPKASDLPFCPKVLQILIFPTLKPTRSQVGYLAQIFRLRHSLACFSNAQPASGSDIMDKRPSPSLTPNVSSDFGHEHDAPVPTYPRAPPTIVPFTRLLSSFPTPPTSAGGSVPVASQSPRPGGASPAIQAPPQASQQPPLYVNMDPTNPQQWNMEQVVAWLRWKGFADDICKKFIEHDITGDVLLELDLHMLKELDIPAFGQRIRVSTAINELRHPYSGASFSAPTYYVRQSLRNIHGSKPALQFLPEPNYMSSLETISSPLDDSWASMTNIFSNIKPVDVLDTHDQNTEVGKAIDPGVTRSAAVEVRNDKSRSMSRALSPSTDSSSERFRGCQQFDVSANRVSEIQEELEAFSDSETLSLRTKMSEFPKNFKNHAEARNASTSDTNPSGSKAFPFTRSTSPECSRSIDTFAKPQHRESNDSPKEDSTESQSSSFDRFLADSAKPTPWHSTVDTGSRCDPGRRPEVFSEETSHNTPSSWIGNKLTRSLSLLHLPSGSTRFPRSIRSLVTRSSSIGGRTRTGSGFQEDGRVHSAVSRMTSETVEKILPPTPDRNVLQLIGEPDREGWLRQRGDRYNMWDPKYFLLKGPHLYSFYNPGEAKLSGYISLKGSRVIADENADPGRYGFRIVHDIRGTQYFSSAHQLTVREWMKALIKVTIDRDYTKPTLSSSHMRTIPLSVAQAMSPPPRPPSPVPQDVRRRTLRSENLGRLSVRDARVLMGLPGENGTTQPEPSGHVSEDPPSRAVRKTQDVPALRLSRKPPSSSSIAVAQNDIELINWINDHIPHASVKATDLSASLATGLVLFRLAESIKGIPNGESKVPDSAFHPPQSDANVDGLIILFDFLLENNVRTGNLRISDVRQGNRDKLVQLVKELKACSEEWLNLERGVRKHYMDLSRPLVAASR